jgi:hypothetical protein
MKIIFNYILVGLSLVTGVTSLNAQNTNVTYQGRVRSGGSDFNGTGQFKFALVTGVDINAQATATAVTSGSFVTIINVNSGGSGYVTAPAVTIFGGGGSGATATASVSGGAVTSITVSNPGSGYGSTPTVIIAAPPENLSYTTYWSHDGTSSAGNEPTTAVSVPVSNGLFTVRLGDGAFANMAPLGTGLFTQPNLQLRIWFNDGVNGFAVLNPAQRLTAAPYALVAGSASNLLGTVSTASLGGTYGNAVTFNNAANSFSGSGAGLTALNASQLASGTVPDARLGGNLARTNQVWLLGGNTGANPTNGAFLGTADNLPLEFKVNNQRALRIEYATNSSYGYNPNLVGGFAGNIVSNGFVGGVIGGGGYSAYPNRVGNHFATVVGGAGNTASGNTSTAMGDGTTASASSSTAMGLVTMASGHYSTAMGSDAKALHSGSFVWADAQFSDFASTANNQFCIRANGGVQLSGDTPVFFGSTLSQKLNLWGTAFGIGIQSGVQYSRVGAGSSFAWYAGGVHDNNTLNAGGGTFLMHLDGNGNLFTAGAVTPSSDRNVKENFAPVQPREMLEKVVGLPLSSWNYKADTATRHVGPMAQDFYAAFNVGPDDKHIATVDADGVALAAIQGLNQKLEEKLAAQESALHLKENRLNILEKKLADLEKLLGKLPTQGN